MMISKPKIVLLHPPLTFEDRYGESKKYTGHVHPPQGLCHLAAMIDESKYSISIIDAQALYMGVEDTIKQLTALKPSVIGIMTFTVSMDTVAKIYDAILEQLPGVHIILGGSHVTACPEETFQRYPQFRVAGLNEGEETFAELVDCLMRNGDIESVKGIIYRSPNGDVRRTAARPYIKDLDTLPTPRWDLLPFLPDYYRPSKMTYRALPAVAIVTSRGCPYDCVFCDRSVFGRRWRAHGVETILHWIDILTTKYGIRDINFQDDHFMVNRTRLISICEGIRSRHPNLIWSAIGRADAVEQESVRMMKESGCWQIAFGIESGSQQILDVLGKDETIEQMEEAVRIVKEAGITVKGLFMVGCPTETAETLQQTEDFIRRLDLDFVSMSAFTPIPNTEIFQRWQDYGRWEGASPDDWHKMNLWEPIFVPHGLTKEQLKQHIKRAPVLKT